ncbi:hypothetical protein TWF192_005767 [Orbilia oligospora]|uniref:RING-type domain-containing protein n=1 Tax=Orbilia oligospora TaxID=2813651 RepID=A0A6G1MLP0_ORBOL|nr:hypothetical protein TWF191_003874 [Orbilia oligospora]KAF3263486.1 hypothetical protein TWF192_005767 [Orbilia oligospora]
MRLTLSFHTLENITGKRSDELFLETYPRLTVFEATHAGYSVPDAIVAFCRHCGRGFEEGENVFTLPCDQSHTFHIICHANYVRGTRNLICPIRGCRRGYSAYENLSAKDKSLVWFACGLELPRKPFAASIDDIWRSIDPPTLRPYFPWGKRRRFLDSVHGSFSSPPAYTLFEINEDTDPEFFESYTVAENLRLGRPTLSQLPYISLLRLNLSRLRDSSTGPEETQRQVINMLELYLFSDITNCIFIMEKLYKHIYLQMRVGCGRLFWFGFREFESYVFRVIAPETDLFLTETTFLDLLRGYSRDASSSLKISSLPEMVTIVHNFENQVDNLERERRNNDRLRSALEELEAVRPYGQTRLEWNLEDQDEPNLEADIDPDEDL